MCTLMLIFLYQFYFTTFKVYSILYYDKLKKSLFKQKLQVYLCVSTRTYSPVCGVFPQIGNIYIDNASYSVKKLCYSDAKWVEKILLRHRKY